MSVKTNTQAIAVSPIEPSSKDLVTVKKNFLIKEKIINLIDRLLHPDILG